MKTKVCTGCKETRPTTDFASDVRHHDGLQSQCNECRISRARRVAVRRLQEQGKACSRCGSRRPIFDFSQHTTDRGQSFYSQCDECRTIKRRCRSCNKELPSEEFDAGRSTCRHCRATKMQERRRQRSPEQAMLRGAKQRAKRNGLEFTLTESDIIIPERCPILDIPILVGDGRQTNNSPSLDRINNSKGYVSGNVAVISYRANAIKSDLTVASARRLLAYMV